MNPLDWIVGHDTGLSSRTIWGVMMNARVGDPSVPHDPDDFGRCYRLLALFPDWRARLSEVVAKYPEWTGLVREWDRLTALYREEVDSGRCAKLYEAMRPLIDEGRLAAGWEKTGPGSWRRGNRHRVELTKGIDIESE